MIGESLGELRIAEVFLSRPISESVGRFGIGRPAASRRGGSWSSRTPQNAPLGFAQTD